MTMTTSNRREKIIFYLELQRSRDREWQMRFPCAFSCPFTWRLITCLVVCLLMFFLLLLSLLLSLSHQKTKKTTKWTHTHTPSNAGAWFYSRAQSAKSKFPRFIKAQNNEMLHLLRYIAIRVTRLHKMDHNEMMRLFFPSKQTQWQTKVRTTAATTTVTSASAMLLQIKLTCSFCKTFEPGLNSRCS